MEKGRKALKNYNLLKFGQILSLFCLLFVGISAQSQEVPKPKPQPVPKTPQVPPVEPVKETPSSGWNRDEIAENDSDIPFEKFIEVDKKVNVGFCVGEGNLKVTGWERDEVRVFVKGGSKAGFKIIKKNSRNQPVWMTIVGYEPLKDKAANLNPCLSGEEIEVDVPKSANVKIDGREASIEVESVAKVYVKNNEGDVNLSEIGQSSEVKTWEGNISLQNSRGSVNLESVNGNILAYQLQSEEVGDQFKAKTNSGTIILQDVQHNVIDATSISGMIKYSGEILNDGQYNFSNTSGQILLTIPKESSCLFQVISEKGKFNTEMPLKNINENVFYPSMQKIVGSIGEGEANINLVTQNGFIRVRKLD